MKRLLLLEDNLDFAARLKSALTERFPELEVEHYTTARVVNDYVNKRPPDYYDIILLDYFAPDGTFHELDIERFDPKRVVAISSMPDRNQQARNRGVQRTAEKNYDTLNETIDNIIEHVQELM